MSPASHSRRGVSYAQVETLDELARVVDFIRRGLPPKILVSHFPFSPKLLSNYWRQCHGSAPSAGGVPGISRLLTRREDRLHASVFSAIYFTETRLPYGWARPEALETVLRARELTNRYGIEYSPVRAWAMARALSNGQVRVSICRDCTLLYVYSASAVTRVQKSCIYCSLLGTDEAKRLVKAISVRKSRVQASIKESKRVSREDSSCHGQTNFHFTGLITSPGS